MNKTRAFVGVWMGLLVMVFYGLGSADSDPTIPSASDFATSTAQGVAITFSLEGASNDGGPIAFATSSDPSRGTLIAIGNGAFTYAPDLGFVGTDSFQYVVTEGATSSPTATVTIAVAAPLDITPPTIQAPPDQSFATSTFPAYPALIFATAKDDADPAPVVMMSTNSFAHGTSTVVWSATDASGNTATTSSRVGVFLRIETTVDVPVTCTVADTDGVAHEYSAASSTDYRAICAIAAAAASGSITEMGLSNAFPSFGLFAASINGVSADATSQYWALYQNGNFASLGLTALPVVAGDMLTLQLHDFSDTNLGDELILHINSLTATSTSSAPSPSGGGERPQNNGGGGGISHSPFRVVDALAFVLDKQHGDGSFDSSLVTDWAAIAFGAADPGEEKTLLQTYLRAETPSLTSVTDYERHAMALMSLGIDPYSGTSINYIERILASFDGAQIGDPSLDNDDIFALLPLLKAGYSANDTIVQKIAAFILSRQKSDGSWDESPDMTAAAIQALGPLYTIPGLNAALGKAAGYLKSTQKADGGWGPVDSTSWVQTAINGIIEAHTPGFETEAAWTSLNGFFPTDALALAQLANGSISSPTDPVWSTSYAIVAASGRSWGSILESFSKPSATPASAGGGSGATPSSAATTQASSTPRAATSTLIASSTLLTLGDSASTRFVEAASTSSATTAPPKPPLKKKITPSKIQKTAPAVHGEKMPVSQAAAAAVSGENFFHRVWSAITFVFDELLKPRRQI
ncbi:MAG: hypothetical protein RLZZ416_101 [Candidatus Parcubacteria bacterium]|jgi:hypothetical protein